MHIYVFTIVWVEYFLNNKLKKLLGHTTFVNSLFSFKLNVQLLLEVRWIVFRSQFKLVTQQKSIRYNATSNTIKLLQTSNNQRLGSVFNDLDPRLSLLCQVGDDVIRPCKICGGCQIHIPRSIHSINVVLYNLNSILY